MKFALSEPENVNAITNYEVGMVRIRQKPYHRSLIVSAQILIKDWRPSSIEQLQDDDFAAVLELQPEVLLLGTGTSQVFPAIDCYVSLLKAGISVEIMNTGAACRTFNILLSEDRPVAAALII